MKALVLSGGASKGAFTAGVLRYLLRDKEMEFDAAVGTSTGALAGGPALLGKYEYLQNIYVSVTDPDIYENGPFFKLINLFKKVGPVAASMEPLHEIVSDYYINRQNLKELNNSKKNFVVTTVNVRTGKPEFISSNQVKRRRIKPETFVNAVVASCSEPVFTRPIRIFEKEIGAPRKNDLYYDGGVKDFLAIDYAVRKIKATEIWVVSTHPLKIKETAWGGNTEPDDVNLLKALGWTIGALLDEVERGDLFRACVFNRLSITREKIKKIADHLSLPPNAKRRLLRALNDMFPGKHTDLPELRVIAPTKPMPTSMEFDPKIMDNYHDEGVNTARRFFRQGAPLFSECVRLLMP
jgi:predicted acylesterase/phospholipase RssA